MFFSPFAVFSFAYINNDLLDEPPLQCAFKTVDESLLKDSLKPLKNCRDINQTHKSFGAKEVFFLETYNDILFLFPTLLYTES